MTNKDLKDCKLLVDKLSNLILLEEKRIILKKEKKVELFNAFNSKKKKEMKKYLLDEKLTNKGKLVNKIYIKVFNSKNNFLLIKMTNNKMLVRTIKKSKDIENNEVNIYKNIYMSFSRFDSFI